jgi:hypothetical protein
MSGTLRPRLVLLRGTQTLAVREVPPDQEWRLGRSPDSPLSLAERSISRQHARLYCDGAGVHLEDLGTPNGTWVDGAQVRGSRLLRDGNVIRLGQSTNPDPLLLRFEDPASRLLDALARAPLPAPAPAGAPVPAPAEADAEKAPEGTVGGVAAAGGDVQAVGGLPVPAAPPIAGALGLPFGSAERREQAPPGSETDLEIAAGSEAEPALTPQSLLRGLGVKAIVGAGLAFVAVFWLLWALKSTQKPWQSVRVEPLRTQAGGRVAVRGSEVEPSDSLKVLVEGQPARVEGMTPGEVVFTVPELPGAEAGTRAASLRVERRGIAVLRQTLEYETRPSVVRIEPAEAAVGDVVVLHGGGFSSDASRIQVRVGGLKAAVVAATPQRLQVRVPVVTRSATAEAPVEVVIEGLASAPVRLTVRPRQAPCHALAFSARPAGARLFEVRHSLGPALFVEASTRVAAAGGSDLPPPVRRAVETLQAAFDKAQGDPSVRFEVRELGRVPVLYAVGLGPSPRELTRFGSAAAAFVREQVPDLSQPELLLYWNAVVLNEVLNLFAKKQPPRLLPASEPAGAALQRLHALNVETGGQGCPSGAEVETLTAAERQALEAAALRVPPRFGDVAGVWEGTFENVLTDEPSKVTLELRLELEQTGTALKGRVFLFELRGPGIRWSPPPLEGLTGRVRLDSETRIELQMPPSPPHYLAQLSGTVSEGTLEGTFRTSRGKEGRFQLAFKPSS